MDFGWKKKAELLRRVIVSAAHPLAKDLAPGLRKTLDLFREVAKNGGHPKGGDGMLDEIEAFSISEEERPIWEPAEIGGWDIQATLYTDNGQLWWLCRVVRKDERAPKPNHLAMLTRILEHLGADVLRDSIIAPTSAPPGEELLPFGWWAWFNRHPLLDVQVNPAAKRDRDKIRVVPMGTPAADGYIPLDRRP